MTGIVTLLYWSALFAVVYPYVFYPPLLVLLARWKGAYHSARSSEGYLPSVTLIISAYNEREVIGRKLDNALALDYPAEKLQIVVISDASDDGTDEIVSAKALVDSRITLHRQPERSGKTLGLNQAVDIAIGEILVFSDANAMYEPAAIRQLIAPLQDRAVGYSVGAAHYSNSGDGEAEDSEGLYWRYELWLKGLESAYGSVVGGDGAIYAIRKELYWPLREDDINDFVNPMQIIAAGYRGVFTPLARCYEEGADSFGKEFGRKRRIVNRSWRAVRRYGATLRSAGNFAFVFQLVSHKVLRWFAAPFLILLTTSNIYLLFTVPGWFYALSLGGLLASMGLALRGHHLVDTGRPQPRIVYLFYYFYLINIAALLGMYDEHRGIRHSKWEHVRKNAS